jgi:hypothetical protein
MRFSIFVFVGKMQTLHNGKRAINAGRSLGFGLDSRQEVASVPVVISSTSLMCQVWLL